MIASCPASRSTRPGLEPLYGTWIIRRFAMLANNSIDRCGCVPRPAEPNRIWPGFALASAIISFTDVAGTDGWTTTKLGKDAACVMGAKSRTASYGAFLFVRGTVTTVYYTHLTLPTTR